VSVQYKCNGGAMVVFVEPCTVFKSAQMTRGVSFWSEVGYCDLTSLHVILRDADTDNQVCTLQAYISLVLPKVCNSMVLPRVSD